MSPKELKSHSGLAYPLQSLSILLFSFSSFPPLADPPFPPSQIPLHTKLYSRKETNLIPAPLYWKIFSFFPLLLASRCFPFRFMMFPVFHKSSAFDPSIYARIIRKFSFVSVCHPPYLILPCPRVSLTVHPPTIYIIIQRWILPFSRFFLRQFFFLVCQVTLPLPCTCHPSFIDSSPAASGISIINYATSISLSWLFPLPFGLTLAIPCPLSFLPPKSRVVRGLESCSITIFFFPPVCLVLCQWHHLLFLSSIGPTDIDPNHALFSLFIFFNNVRLPFLKWLFLV